MLDEVIRRYNEIITCKAHDLGIPRHKIFTHIGASFKDQPPGNVYNTAAASLSKCAQPGLSIYSYAYDPAKAPTLLDGISHADNTHWGSVEWFYYQGNKGTIDQQWEQAIANNLGYHNNRLVHVYNWHSIANNATILSGVIRQLKTEPKCLLEMVTINEAIIQQDTVRLSWTVGSDAAATYLLVSTIDDVLPSGVLTTPNVVNLNVPLNTPSYTLSSKGLSGTYYWMVVSDGCEPRQRMVSDVGVFEIRK